MKKNNGSEIGKKKSFVLFEKKSEHYTVTPLKKKNKQFAKEERGKI